MSTHHGQFVWYELMTTDIAAAAAFYGAVLGWSARDSGMPNHDYTIVSVGEAGVGGIMGMPQHYRDAGGRPGWIGYVGVDDVDAIAARVVGLGGSIHRGPEDIPTVGRFAVVADPQGASFVLFTPQAMQTPQPPPPKAMAPGHVGWHELFAADRETAFDFYAGLFGWTKGNAVDTGPMGIYQIFAAGGPDIGGMMTKPEAVPAPFWQYYFNVPDIDAAVARVKDSGGQVLNGPMEVPGGAWIVHGMDPQGASFALVGMKV
jgi:predicted enzyme related to lactoylglutathione lyase